MCEKNAVLGLENAAPLNSALTRKLASENQHSPEKLAPSKLAQPINVAPRASTLSQKSARRHETEIWPLQLNSPRNTADSKSATRCGTRSFRSDQKSSAKTMPHML